jgi:hypothetical protein
MDTQVHMVMGTEEATVISTALGMLLTLVNHDIEKWQDKNPETQDEFMTMLSVKFSAEHIYSALVELLEKSDDDKGDE